MSNDSPSRRPRWYSLVFVVPIVAIAIVTNYAIVRVSSPPRLPEIHDQILRVLKERRALIEQEYVGMHQALIATFPLHKIQSPSE